MVIADEVHYCKTHRAERTRALKKLNARFKVGLSGTPLDGRLEELHSIFEFLQPGLFPSKSKFIEKYARKNYWGAIDHYVNVGEFKSRIRPYYIRRLKKDVLHDLPDKIYQDIWVEFDKKAMQEYQKLAQRKHEITEETEAIVAVIRARQFCDFPEILDLDFTSAKYGRLVELLNEIVKQNKHKVIIFSQYKKVVHIINGMLSDEYNILVFHGDIPSKKRMELCERFNNEDDAEIMLMTDSGSIGINLQAASYVINFDDNYAPSIMNQRADRAHRIGQKNVVTVIRFICKNTIEERVRKILDKKSRVIADVLDEDCTEFALGRLTNRELLDAL